MRLEDSPGGERVAKAKKAPLLLSAMALFAAAQLCGQSNPRASARSLETLRLEEAVDYALKHYPAVAAALEQTNRARSGVALTRTAYLPQVNAIYQAGRATQNQVAGIFLPSAIAPSVEGPVQPYAATNFWNTQAGALLSWEPFDFGLHRATVEQARSLERKSDAGVELTRLQVAAAAGGYFLSLVSLEQTVTAAQANVRRWEAFGQAVHVLVENELRPGVEASRADAEEAAARTQLYQAQAVAQQARALLAALLGTAPGTIQIESSLLLTLPPVDSLPSTPASAHPLALDARASVEQGRAQQHVLDRTDYPRVFLASEVFGRGSGANPDGTPAGGVRGLGLSRGNWLAGISVVFPSPFDFSALRDQKRMAQAQERSQEAKYEQTLEDLNGQIGVAQAGLTAALQIAKNTPFELTAARQAETQARARYQSGLTNLVEVAEAESLLAQAERDDAVAHVSVWQALFNLAVAQGNLEPFLEVLRSGNRKAVGSRQ